jgi:hypothetical protein
MARAQHGHAKHVWRFFRAGGFDQVRLDSGRDIAALGELDQKLWVALACPTRGLEFDEATLDLIDADRDGRIRAPDILAAVAWTVALLKNPEDLIKGSATLPLDAIADATPEGQQILASARAILRLLGKEAATEISLEDAAHIEQIYDGSAFNGDGVVPLEAAEDDDTRSAIAQIIACIGPEQDRSGRPGVSQATADRFFAEAASFAAWRAEAAEYAAVILPLGESTEAVAGSLAVLRDQLDDYFTRCRLAAFDPRAAESLNPPLAAYEALAGTSVAADQDALRALPLARIEASRALKLTEGVNPAWADALARFRQDIVAPLIGARDSLTESDWETIKTRFAPYRDWTARKPATTIEPLGIAAIRQLVEPAVKQKIDGLIAQDLALEPEMSAISRVEKLLRFLRDLHKLLNNVVSFRDFYTRSGKGMFQAGTLYLDGRSCELCVKVEDETKHAQLATLSRIYLTYCVCTRGIEKMTIAAAFTAGDSDNLRVGRNGVFYDRKGRDWDANIVKIVEHPISLPEAFWLPYKQVGRMISEQIQKAAAARSAAQQGQQQAQLIARSIGGPAQAAPPAAGAAPAAPGAPAPTPAGSPAFDAARFAGIFAAIGLAIGAIGTAVATLVTGFLNLVWWQMPLAVLGVILAISGPSMVIAALKLRSRNLGPILDASGWAVNTRLRVNIPFGTALTAVAQLPPGAQRALTDPYAEKRQPWVLYLIGLAILVALGLLWWQGYLAAWLHRL